MAMVMVMAWQAPVEVVCVLKSLIDDEEMTLADGKRIVPPGALSRLRNLEASASVSQQHGHPLLREGSVLEMHPDFRVIVLANRPGYPFLGNDFFREIGAARTKESGQGVRRGGKGGAAVVGWRPHSTPPPFPAEIEIAPRRTLFLPARPPRHATHATPVRVLPRAPGH